MLLGFPGTVLMVSHDRAFLDNVVTSTLVFEGEGRVREYVGGYQDWLRQGGSPRLLGVGKEPLDKGAREDKPAPAEKAVAPVAVARKKLSYKDQRELDALPGQIEALENEQAALQEETASPEFYLQPQEQVQATLARLEAIQQELDRLLERWAELEG
ncbi:ABC transporter ATP-binding protein uup [compost metagenome]